MNSVVLYCIHHSTFARAFYACVNKENELTKLGVELRVLTLLRKRTVQQSKKSTAASDTYSEELEVISESIYAKTLIPANN